jgi:hypothetical protein
MADSNGKKPEVDPARAMSANHQPATAKEVAKERPKLKPLEGVTAKKLKTPLSTRLRQAFTNDDARSVGDYLLFDVAVPAIKSTIFDLIQGGASRALFGQGVASRHPARGSSINYNQISRGQGSSQPSTIVQPAMSARDRATFNFDGIIFPTRAGAERALTVLIETIEQYQVVGVADLYDLVGITPSFADDKWGWFNLQGADIVPVRTGFILDMPAVQPIR